VAKQVRVRSLDDDLVGSELFRGSVTAAGGGHLEMIAAAAAAAVLAKSANIYANLSSITLSLRDACYVVVFASWPGVGRVRVM